MIWIRIESLVSGDRELEKNIRKVVDICAEESETNENKVGITRILHRVPPLERNSQHGSCQTRTYRMSHSQAEESDTDIDMVNIDMVNIDVLQSSKAALVLITSQLQSEIKSPPG
jgi:hypothetical protein